MTRQRKSRMIGYGILTIVALLLSSGVVSQLNAEEAKPIKETPETVQLSAETGGDCFSQGGRIKCAFIDPQGDYFYIEVKNATTIASSK